MYSTLRVDTCATQAHGCIRRTKVHKNLEPCTHLFIFSAPKCRCKQMWPHTLYDFVINQLHIGRIYGNIRKDNKNFLVLTLFMGASVEREEEVNKIKYIHTLTTSDSFNQRTSQQLSIKEFLKFVRQYLKNE